MVLLKRASSAPSPQQQGEEEDVTAPDTRMPMQFIGMAGVYDISSVSPIACPLPPSLPIFIDDQKGVLRKLQQQKRSLPTALLTGTSSLRSLTL